MAYKIDEFAHFPHEIPDATPISDGVMSVADKVKLDLFLPPAAVDTMSYKIPDFAHEPHIFPNASTTSPGMMSASDKAKLDALVPSPPTTNDLLDFTQNSGSLVASRTGSDAYVALSSQVAKKVVAGATPLYENRGGKEGGGVWSFPAITNLITTPLNVGGAGWSTQSAPVITAADCVAPDGTQTGARVADADPAANTAVYQQPVTAANSACSIWARVPKDNPPTTGAGGVYRQLGAFTNPPSPSIGVSIPADPTGGASPSPSPLDKWRRLRYFVNGGIGNFVIYPAGATGNADFDIVAQGAAQLWGAQGIGTGDIPLIDGASGAAIVQLAAGDLADVLNAAGDFHARGSFIQQYLSPVTFGGPTDPVYIFSSAGPDGLLALRYNLFPVQTWEFLVGGVVVLTTPAMGVGETLSEFTWEVWHIPSLNTSGIRLMSNGAVQYSVETQGAAAGVLPTRTSFYLGSNIGASSLSAQHTQLQFLYDGDPSALEPDILVFGDSIWAYGPAVSPTMAATPMAASYLYDAAFKQWRPPVDPTSTTPTGKRIVSFAVPFDTINGQKAVWLASPYATASSVQCAILNVGFNDVNNGIDSAATILANLQSLVDQLTANIPGIKIIICAITPGVAGGTAATRVSVNTGIAGGGGTPITGVDARVSANSTNLESAANVLAAIYNSGDGVHPNELGRLVALVPPVVAAATQLGILP